MFAHITNNLDVAVSVVAVCAISLTVPSQYWSVKYICSDIGLFCFAIFAYWVMWRFKKDRDRPKKGCQEACTASIHESSVDESELELSTQVASEVVEVIKAEEPQFDVSSHIVVMQKYANERNIAGTMRTFRLIKKNGVPPSSQMYNIVLQAWINCGNVQAAEDLMEEITGAGLADETSYNLLIKVLVSTRALDKANGFLKDMKKASLTPSVAAFDNLLSGFAREGRFNESLSLLEEMHAGGVHPSNDTLNNIVKLLNGSRNIDQRLARVQQILLKYNIDATSVSPVPVAMPRLAAVISQAEESKTTCCAHEMHITGSLSQIKAVRKTLKQHGLLDNTESGCSPLDGHWETDHGLTVIVEGKLVRWSAQRACKLSFTNKERTGCTMSLYGEATNGRLVSPATSPHASKSLVWENGDVWQSYDGRVIGQDTFFSQCMTKMVRDQFQDLQYQARSSAMLKCVSRQALNIPVMLEQSIVEFLGNDLYYVRVHFESKSNPSKKVSNDDDDDLGPLPFETDQDTCNAISLRHPRVGLRHCWAEKGDNSYGQRTLVNGQEVNEDDFSRHVQYVCWA